MSLSRRRSDRPDPARRRFGSPIEALEGRQLLSGTTQHYRFYRPYPYDVPVRAASVYLPSTAINHPIGSPAAVLAGLDNDGKIISGRDRQGDQYTITVHGPGVVIVTDATPNDGVLDDDIATIQIVGSDPNKTVVSGQTTAVGSGQTTSLVLGVDSVASTQTDGTVFFNQLIAQSGVKSIILNGFILTETVTPINGGLPNSETGIYLAGGARNLEFTGVEAFNDSAASAGPINLFIGDRNNPLPFKPNIRIDRLTNTAFDSTSTVVSNTPQTTPSINIIVNGETGKLQFVSASQVEIPASLQFLFPITGTTGRSSVQTRGIDRLKFSGGATNVTASRAAQPFSGSFNGLSHIGSADFNGPTDAVALDVAGKIGFLRFARGAGSPVGLNPGSTPLATTFGTPDAQVGYPGRGLVGALVSARKIGHLKVAPADVTLQTSNNPDLLQERPGSTVFFNRPGRALNRAAIVSQEGIDQAVVVGDSLQSEIKTGFNLTSYNQGLQSTRGRSRIGRIRYRGSLVNSVISASFTPGLGNDYSGVGAIAGPGTINGDLDGTIVTTQTPTVLNNVGAGVFAANKNGHLPPPSGRTRIVAPGRTPNGVLRG